MGVSWRGVSALPSNLPGRSGFEDAEFRTSLKYKLRFFSKQKHLGFTAAQTYFPTCFGNGNEQCKEYIYGGGPFCATLMAFCLWLACLYDIVEFTFVFVFMFAMVEF